MNKLVDLTRRMAWRLGRMTYRAARRDNENDSQRNGEYWLLRHVAALETAAGSHVLDVGSNVGNWSREMDKELRRRGRFATIHAFEPAAETYASLSAAVGGSPNIKPHNLAISSNCGVAEFYVTAPNLGTNSLTPAISAAIERVETVSVDELLTRLRISSILMVKSDTEGHDLAVLRGAKAALSAGLIEVWQFEYNHLWVQTGASLYGLFLLIKGSPYSLGKLYGDGIELYEEWHPELERYFETNYVLIRNDSRLRTLARTVAFNSRNVPIEQVR